MYFFSPAFQRLVTQSLMLMNELSKLDETNLSSTSTLSSKLKNIMTSPVSETDLHHIFHSNSFSSSLMDSSSKSEELNPTGTLGGSHVNPRRSRSLDNLLENSHVQWSKSSIKRKVGSSKFYIMGYRDKETFAQGK